jgi:hypothetical protein
MSILASADLNSFLLHIIIGLLVNINHFCKWIKRDLYEMKTGKSWDE